MPPITPGQSILEDAYKLATPGDNAAYYDAFAATYDGDFVAQMGYQYPRAIANAYRSAANPDDAPIADIGCGTGLVAAELALPDTPIDGMDISPEMLAVAGRKGLYRSLSCIDLTGRLIANTTVPCSVLAPLPTAILALNPCPACWILPDPAPCSSSV